MYLLNWEMPVNRYLYLYIPALVPALNGQSQVHDDAQEKLPTEMNKKVRFQPAFYFIFF